ncbi:YchJ family protein [Empedobacter brevis]|uniref:YchJ family protein n=1 Tax=Empedobacter brevis TaxID=247 RepID=UPI0039B0C3D7
MNCPCCSGKEYKNCCESFHLNKELPKTPEELMRSRYAAFSLVLPEYLMDTTHKSTRKNNDFSDIEDWAKSNKWLKLEIVFAKDNKVRFRAYYQYKKGEIYEHDELSTFVQENGKWFYVDGVFY